ncbi:MAG: flavin reductase family protein [Gemmatimonadales bacterium]
MTHGEQRVTPSEFRTLIGSFASGVSVITATDGNGRATGMTATAVTAVSLDPPLISVCVNNSDPLHTIMRGATIFAVNILAEGQVTMSRRFAGEHALRFHEVAYTEGLHGVPLLDSVVAQILCKPWKEIEAGDHSMFLGLVTAGSVFERLPLLHYRGRYGTTRDLA